MERTVHFCYKQTLCGLEHFGKWEAIAVCYHFRCRKDEKAIALASFQLLKSDLPIREMDCEFKLSGNL